MLTLKASPPGLRRIKQARIEKGWTIYDPKWLQEASQVLGVCWEEEGILAEGISEGTWKRFLAGKYPINAGAFKAYCQVLGLKWQQVMEGWENQNDGAVSNVYIIDNRLEELQILKQWIMGEKSRLVALLDRGGMEKTTVAAKVMPEMPIEFEYFRGQSLCHTALVEEMLTEIMLFVSKQQESGVLSSFEGNIWQLLNYLCDRLYLLVLLSASGDSANTGNSDAIPAPK